MPKKPPFREHKCNVPPPLGEVNAKLFPNGECVIWKKRTHKPKSNEKLPTRAHRAYAKSLLNLASQCPEVLITVGDPLGLSILRNFDRNDGGELKARPVQGPKPLKRYGLKGITAHGRRVVRNACHLIENEGGNSRVTFATVTLPALPFEQAAEVHKNWARVFESYRRNMRRVLQDNGLSGEMVSINEVQEKRYESTGIPYLHIHSVFIGRHPKSAWVITPEIHDKVWLACLEPFTTLELEDVAATGNLQRVNKSASGYMGKYLTKGAKAVTDLVSKGFSGWMPKQWWGCSHRLRRRIDKETRRIDCFADVLLEKTLEKSAGAWKWYRHVEIEMNESHKFTVATYGQLNPDWVKEIHDFLTILDDT